MEIKASMEFLKQSQQGIFGQRRGFERIVKLLRREVRIRALQQRDQPLRAAGASIQRVRVFRQGLVCPGRRDSEAGMHQQSEDTAQRRKWIERRDSFTPSGGQYRVVLQEK